MFLKAVSICQKLQYRRKLTPPFDTIMQKNEALRYEASKNVSIYLKELWIGSLQPFESSHDLSQTNRNAVGIPKAEFVHKPNAWYWSIDKARSDWGWSPKTIVVLSFSLLLVDFTVAKYILIFFLFCHFDSRSFVFYNLGFFFSLPSLLKRFRVKIFWRKYFPLTLCLFRVFPPFG